MKDKRWILWLIGLCIGFLIGFVKLIVVYPNQKQNFEKVPRFAVSGTTVTFRTVSLTDDMTVKVSANVDNLEQISETEYRFTMPFHNVYLDAKIVQE